VKPNRFIEQVEAARVDSEDGWDDSAEHFSRPRPMIEVRAIVLPAGVMEESEKAHYCQIGTTAFSDIQTKCIDPLPVAWPVDGMRSALENGHHVFPDTSKPSLWRGFHIRKSSDSLSHLHLLFRGDYKSYRRGQALSKVHLPCSKGFTARTFFCASFLMKLTTNP
jgi:hypothetical protein